MRDDSIDAKRYRWLRDKSCQFEEVGSTSPYVVRGQTMEPIDGLTLDRAVDFQLRCQLDKTSEAEFEAHARLIAAAPELLEACKSAEMWLEGWASAEPYISKIRAAIDKATGQKGGRK